MNKDLRKFLVAGVAVLVIASGCRKRDALESDNFVNYETTALGITASESGGTIKLQLIKPTDRDIAITLNLSEFGAAYGIDYTTTPVASGGKLNLVIPSGNNETSFTISKAPGAFFVGDEKIQLDLYSSATPVFIGAKKQLTVTFGEITALNTSLTVNGGGANYPNKVFIDLSANRQTAVLRTNWDLGFYTGNDDNRVILNSSSAMMAKQLTKTDLTQVTAADTVGFSVDVAFSQFAPTTSSLVYIDYPSGELTKTAIAAVSANNIENKVYIINRGTGVGVPAPARGWKKVRILRNASGGYTLQHADIASTTFTSVEIVKDDAYFFKFVSFESGVVNVEPQKKKWDLGWSYFSNVTNFGTGEVPYLFQDIILINRNVSIARVMTTFKIFEDFNETDISTQTFLTAQNAFAADWRAGGGPSSPPAIRTDRYYVIKDGENNYYKIRFTGLTQNGERGYPSYQSVLVKKG